MSGSPAVWSGRQPFVPVMQPADRRDCHPRDHSTERSREGSRGSYWTVVALAKVAVSPPAAKLTLGVNALACDGRDLVVRDTRWVYKVPFGRPHKNLINVDDSAADLYHELEES
jgi:hypothetical protein